jgi:hypothetical protein
VHAGASAPRKHLAALDPDRGGFHMAMIEDPKPERAHQFAPKIPTRAPERPAEPKRPSHTPDPPPPPDPADPFSNIDIPSGDRFPGNAYDFPHVQEIGKDDDPE